MSLFQLGNFTLNSGAVSAWKLECDALTDDDWQALARMVQQMVGPFSSVEGVPRGGLKLAECLKPLCSLAGPHLIVDDVLTTGGSMERMRQDAMDNRSIRIVTGAVVFARGQCPLWVKPLFQMPQCFWLSPLKRGAT